MPEWLSGVGQIVTILAAAGALWVSLRRAGPDVATARTGARRAELELAQMIEAEAERQVARWAEDVDATRAEVAALRADHQRLQDEAEKLRQTVARQDRRIDELERRESSSARLIEQLRAYIRALLAYIAAHCPEGADPPPTPPPGVLGHP